MKCHDPDSDKAADIQIYANGLPCAEYGFPPSVDIEYGPRTVACFIPVSDGDILTVKGDFTGTVLNGTFDLLVDGSYLGDRRIEGAKTGVPKVVKRKLEILQAHHMPPAADDDNTIMQHPPVVEGDLRTLRLEHAPTNTFDEGGEFGIGTLVVNISMNQAVDDTYRTGYDSTFAGEWEDRQDYKMNDAGVTPTHQLELVVTDNQMHPNRQSKYRRNFRTHRPGKHPWVTLVFFYRSIKAIADSGCKLRVDDSHALKPIVTPKAGAPLPGRPSVQIGQSSDFAQSMTRAQQGGASDFTQDTSDTKPKLFGNRLFSRSVDDLVGTTPFHGQMAPPPPPSTLNHPNNQEETQPPIQVSGFPHRYSQPQGMISRHQVSNLADSFTPTSELAMSAPYGGASLRAGAGHTPKSLATTVTPPSPPVRVKPEPYDEDSMFIADYFGDEMEDEMSPANPSPGPMRHSEIGPPPPFRMISPTTGYKSPATSMPTTFPHPANGITIAGRMRSVAFGASPTGHARSATIHSTQCLHPSPGLQAPSHSRKHSIGSLTESDAKVKKNRVNERNATLKAQLEEKKRRNEALRVKVEEQRRRREEEAKKREEEEERRQAELEAEENVELERLIAAQDEEYEWLQEAVEMDEDQELDVGGEDEMIFDDGDNQAGHGNDS